MATMTDRELLRRLDRVRWKAMDANTAETVFYARLAAELVDEIADVPTASTDGKRIRWGREFLEKLTDDEALFVLMHEVLHCAHGHLWRFPAGGGHDHALANKACDIAINGTLKRSGLKVPAEAILDPRFDDKAEEEIYRTLRDESKLPEPPDGEGEEEGSDVGEQPLRPIKSGEGEGEKPPVPNPKKYRDPYGYEEPADKGGPGDGEGEDGEGGKGGNDKVEPGDDENLRDKWERAVITADQVSKLCGKETPDSVRARLAKARERRIDWREETSAFLKTAVAGRNDWARQHRRHALAGYLVPRKRRDQAGLVVFVRDTSGSISAKVLSAFNAFIESAVAECGFTAVIIDCDSRIQAETRVEVGDEIPVEAQGGGGTDFRPPFARAAELVEEGESVAGLVYLTDLCGPEPTAEEVTVPTLWLVTEKETAATGRTVRIETED